MPHENILPAAITTRHGLPEPSLDEVETDSRDSFPAGDPPSWTPVTGTGNPSPPQGAGERAARPPSARRAGAADGL